ncbi:hypothetical protein HD806DRAFT_492999 [Xylariaceae sp. AK1471]|nr:hypothetical protein HD806DRAFT_492999 [Xylariaceae sp. AK1471]
MLISRVGVIFSVLTQASQAHILWPIQLQARDVPSTTEYVITSTTCKSWSQFVTTIPPMTTVYAVIAESLDPAAAVGQTISLDDAVVVVIATGVQNIGTCVVTAPEIITTARVETGSSPIDCSNITSTVTSTIAPTPPASNALASAPTTVVVTQQATAAASTIVKTQVSVVVSVSQQVTTEKGEITTEKVTEHVTDVQTEVQTQVQTEVQTVTIQDRGCKQDWDCDHECGAGKGLAGDAPSCKNGKCCCRRPEACK